MQLPATDLGYRRDIDGLRALAVMGVVLYHASFKFAKGGFVGVDVFFVISGFLITNHIVKELNAGTFSFMNFYERRVRRIAPALFVMMLVVLALSSRLLMPEDFISTALSAVAATISLSNFYFWQTVDYWHSGPRALLHTWSLSIEEQFYLFSPILLFWLFKRKASAIPATLWALFIASLVLNMATFRSAPDASFYLLPQRAWELLLGSLFGIGAVSFPQGRVARQVLSAAALTCIFAIILFPETPFAPFDVTVLACLATGTLLAAGDQGETMTGRLLSIAPARWIGLASYSIYLWHEPLIFFLKNDTSIIYGKVLTRAVPALSIAQAVTVERLTICVVGSLMLGFLSWHFIERPFRYGAFRPSREKLFQVGGASAAIIVAVGGVVVGGAGFPKRFPDRAIAIAQMPMLESHFADGVCFPGSVPESAVGRCKPLSKDRPNWLLIGDSIAFRLGYGLHTVFPEVNTVTYTVTGCQPVLDERAGERAECHAAYEKLYNQYLKENKVDRVVIAGNWQPHDIARLDRVFAVLKERNQPAVLVGPNMHYDVPARLLLAASIANNDPTLASRHRLVEFDDLDKKLAERARNKWGVPYFSYAPFCPGGNCVEWAAPDKPFVFDEVHITDEASILVARKMKATGFLN